MYDFSISKEQARQFAYDCFDVIIRDVKMLEAVSYTHLDVYKRQVRIFWDFQPLLLTVGYAESCF